jgi:hypothetical protein
MGLLATLMACLAGESLPYPAPENGRVPTEQYKWLTIQQVTRLCAALAKQLRARQ